MGLDPPDEFMGRFEYSQDDGGGVKLGGMNVSVMDLHDARDEAPIASPAPSTRSRRYTPDSPLGYLGN